MKHLIHLIFLSCILLSCENKKREPATEMKETITKNISNEMISNLEWMNEAKSFEVVDGSLNVMVTKDTDFFNNPEDSSIVGSAPLLYQNMNGDFVAKALVQPDFNSQWNAVSLMVHIDSMNWIKFAFENSDATGPSIVTVVTKGTSDDANGAILKEQGKIWLAIAKKNNLYSMHWSVDNKNYKMARLTSMPVVNEVKIGVEFQSPVGDEAKHQLHFFEIKEKTVEKLRVLE